MRWKRNSFGLCEHKFLSLKVGVISSFQTNSANRTKPNQHYIGHAIDVKLLERGKWYDRICPGTKEKNWTVGVSCFINALRADNTFRLLFNCYYVHIKSTNRPWKEYQEIYTKLQMNCRVRGGPFKTPD